MSAPEAPGNGNWSGYFRNGIATVIAGILLLLSQAAFNTRELLVEMTVDVRHLAESVAEIKNQLQAQLMPRSEIESALRRVDASESALDARLNKLEYGRRRQP